MRSVAARVAPALHKVRVQKFQRSRFHPYVPHVAPQMLALPPATPLTASSGQAANATFLTTAAGASTKKRVK